MILTHFLKPTVKANIKSFLFSIKRLIAGRKKIITNYPIIEYQSTKTDTFFGYYDISPFNSNDEILYVELHNNKNNVDVVIDSLDGNAKKVLTSSFAWNWQQGCRLRWISDDVISFNDFRDGRYLNRIINVRTQIERNFPWPFYDIDKNNCYGLTLNFERLGKLRPGYGYNCIGSFNENLDSAAITLIHLKSQRVLKYLSYKDIREAFNCNIDLSLCYVNHLSFSPDGKRFLFFWIEIIKGYHKALMGVFDIDKDVIIPLELNYKVSHYVWLDNNRLLCTVYLSPQDCRYFIYSIEDRVKEPYCEGCLRLDGHPSVYDRQHIITDTYPDANGYQYLRYVDSDRNKYKNLAEVYSTPVTSGERRTDLHPRFNISKNAIAFDANIRGRRSMFIIKDN